jgi:hypothetical protein
MNIEISWQAVGLLATLAMAWSAFLVGIIKWLVTKSIGSMEDKISVAATGAKAAADDAKAAASALQQHRETCLQFRGTLPIDYFRREDMIRFETLTHAKLDALASDIRTLECRKCQHKAQ